MASADADDDAELDEGPGGVDAAGGGGKKKKVKPGSFQGLGLSPTTFKAIMKMGYNMPTPIQRKTIPVILDGQDVVAMARTGSGKTAAFLIPVVERLKAHSVSVGFRAVALSPTRELAMQTAKFFRQLSKFSDLRCCLLVGGQAMEAQFEHLANNPDVIIATPGRLMHHILEAEISLSRVEVLILDEADRLFELGFAEQLQKILDATPLSRQCLLFSATLPAQLVSFSRVGLKDPVFVRLDVETTLSDALDLWYLYIRKDEKIAAAVSVLRFLAKPDKSTIMFVATRHHVEFFGELLSKVGISAAVVYGSMDQDQRTAQITRFRKKKASVLVTTDVAARGIDVPLLDYVLNYDFPPSGKLFVHRAGRTARAGRSGLAISLVTLEDLPYTVELMLFLGRKIQIADGTPSAAEAFAAGAKGPPLLGALPGLEHEVETLSALMEEQDSDLQVFHKSMIASYRLYNKTRPSASKQSVARARLLLEECGGPARLQGLVHPAFDSERGSGKAAIRPAVGATGADLGFIQELRAFRPKAEKVGNVLSTSAMRVMELAKTDAATMRSVRQEGEAQLELLERPVPSVAALSALRGDSARAAPAEEGEAGAGGLRAKGRSRALKRKLALISGGAAGGPTEPAHAEAASVIAESDKVTLINQAEGAADAATLGRGPRMSKRARVKLARGGAGPGGAAVGGVASMKDFADEFDISVDGVQLGVATASSGSTAGSGKASKKGLQSEQFFLSVERDSREEAKERGLDMEQYQMDLMPDDSSDIKKAKSVIRWDAKKKKYLPVMVSADGRVLKSGSRTNESGQRVKGEGEKSNLYQKWAKSTKKRIQKVGEMEQAYTKPLSRREQQQQAAAAARASTSTVEFDDTGNSHKSGGDAAEAEGGRKRKPVVPFYGEIEEKYLTAKQKRMLKRRAKKDTVSYGDAQSELRSVTQMQLDKKLRDRNKLKQKPHLRREKAKKAKEVRMKMMEERQMKYGARTRSRMLIIEGTKQRKKGGRFQRRGMPTI